MRRQVLLPLAGNMASVICNRHSTAPRARNKTLLWRRTENSRAIVLKNVPRGGGPCTRVWCTAMSSGAAGGGGSSACSNRTWHQSSVRACSAPASLAASCRHSRQTEAFLDRWAHALQLHQADQNSKRSITIAFPLQAITGALLCSTTDRGGGTSVARIQGSSFLTCSSFNPRTCCAPRRTSPAFTASVKSSGSSSATTSAELPSCAPVAQSVRGMGPLQ